MKKIFDRFFRQDLELSKKRWHRLFKVVFFLILAGVALTIWDNNSPSHGDYYEVVGTLSDYISKHSEKSLVNLEKMIGKNTYIINKDDGNSIYKIGKFVDKPYIYYGDRPDWIIIANSTDIYRLTNMQCKDGMTIEDVKKYRSSHLNDIKYYSRIAKECKSYPTDLLLTSAIRENFEEESNCIFSSDGCTLTVGKYSDFMDKFVVISKTEKSIKNAEKIYYKELILGILKSLGITIIVAIIIMFMYYKGFIYIVYGNKK